MTKLLDLVILPPMGLLWLGILGLLVIRRHSYWGRGLVTVALLGIYVLGTPYLSSRLIVSLQEDGQAQGVSSGPAQAIVILGCGFNPKAQEFGHSSPQDCTLERLHYGAHVARQTQLPVMVTGGGGGHEGEEQTEAGAMRWALEQGFQIPVKWIETHAMTTFENASLSRPILAHEGVDHIYLVTHAWHMKRAKWAFERAGFQVKPAPTGFSTPSGLRWIYFIPNTHALRRSYTAIHEWVGWWWYHLMV